MSTNDMVQIPRSVLEKVQWQNDSYEPYCEACNARYRDGHKEDCPIGIALKPKEVVEKVIPQHEMVVDGHKMVTRIGGGIDCLGCYFKSVAGECMAAYYDGGIDSKCCGGSNADMENRIWVKVATCSEVKVGPVQHEMEFGGNRYHTVFGNNLNLSEMCCECDVDKECGLGALPDESNLCMAYSNPDRKDRVWKKVG